jgi:hypothetical protein
MDDADQQLHQSGLELEAIRGQLKQRMLSLAMGFPTAERVRAWREWNASSVARLEEIKADLINVAFEDFEGADEGDVESFRQLTARLLYGCDNLSENFVLQQAILDPMISELEEFEALNQARP